MKTNNNSKSITSLKQKQSVNINLDNNFANKIVQAAVAETLDISKIEGFSTVAQTREQFYQIIDQMVQDSTIASVIETYAEDCTETNDNGQIVWCESKNESVGKYVTYLLKSMEIDKHAYPWIVSFCKYGDIYLRLYRESDYKKDSIFNSKPDNDINESNYLNESVESVEEPKNLNESVSINIHNKDDHYVHYLEKISNPAEMFDLTRFGKTAGYIQAPITNQVTYNNQSGWEASQSSFLRYKVKRNDIQVYEATSFVHGCLDDNSNRVPEEVSIFLNDDDYIKNNSPIIYTVRRGQSLLANLWKTWRQLSLLENSVILNRITKSSIVRIISVETGDMGQEQIASVLSKVKQMIEQKSAVDTGKSMSEYTNPGPIENNIYVPTHGGIGNISTQQFGGDVDPKQLTDLNYFQNKFFGSLRIPKAFFGITDDGAGFNGGQSLSIISSRYGKAVKRIQNAFIQTITDAINYILIDKGLVSWVNQFTLRMQAPITQEEIDRRSNKDNRVRYVSDIMTSLSEVSDPVIKMSILKILLSSVINDSEIINLIQQQIDKLEKEQETASTDINDGVEINNKDHSPDNFSNKVFNMHDDEKEESEDENSLENSSETSEDNMSKTDEIEKQKLNNQDINNTENKIETDETSKTNQNNIDKNEENKEDILPTPNELGIDLTKNL